MSSSGITAINSQPLNTFSYYVTNTGIKHVNVPTVITIVEVGVTVDVLNATGFILNDENVRLLLIVKVLILEVVP